MRCRVKRCDWQAYYWLLDRNEVVPLCFGHGRVAFHSPIIIGELERVAT